MPGHSPTALAKLIYQTFVKLLSWMALRARSDTANEIEILVLRHQLAVLHLDGHPGPGYQPHADRAVIAAPARLLPVRRRHGFLVTPTTIPRLHRHLVRRRWTTPPVRSGRPAIPDPQSPSCFAVFVDHVPAAGQAARTARFLAVACSGHGPRNLAAMMTRRSLTAMSS